MIIAHCSFHLQSTRLIVPQQQQPEIIIILNLIIIHSFFKIQIQPFLSSLS